MNPTPQLDLHPDADSLNAFVEQALAAPEREQVFAHLAACSRCRQVIYLAQQAAADAEAAAPASVPAVRSATQPGAWFTSWRLAWVPAVALALALALVVVFYPRPTAPAPELAKVAPRSEPALPTPALQDQPGAEAAPTPAPSAPARSTGRNAKSAPDRAPSGEPAPEAAPAAALPAEPAFIALSNVDSNAAQPAPGAAMVGQALAQREGAAQFKPQPAVAAWQQERQPLAGTLSTNANAAQASQKSMRNVVETAHASHPVSVAAAVPRSATPPVPANRLAAGLEQPMAEASAPRDTSSIKLPSGLTVVSTATAAHRTLAIDLAGALFLSEDSGKHWEPVARQWTGRPIEVRVPRGPSGNSAPAPAFELMSDGGLVWVSPDGKTWTPQ
jgi:hypothetical protein